MKKSIYNSYLLYNSNLFDIMEIQTNDILILVNNNFARKKKAVIKNVKIMPKN